MRFLIDENVDIRVVDLFSAPQGTLFSRAFETEYVPDVFGQGTKDPVIRAYVKARGLILVTADRVLALRCGQIPRLPCLWLKGIDTQEYARTAALLDVVLPEAERMGGQFWMEIGLGEYRVRR